MGFFTRRVAEWQIGKVAERKKQVLRNFLELNNLSIFILTLTGSGATSIQTFCSYRYLVALPLQHMIKWFAFILLLITTACTCIPCCSDDACGEDEAAASNKSGKADRTEGCSPFFACAGCHTVMELTRLSVEFTACIVPVIQHQESIMPFNLSSFSSSCWQPPRHC